MKKTLFTIFALAAILVSCTKESEISKSEEANKEGNASVFTATFADDFGVKTTLDSGTKQVFWEKNDKITINRVSFSAQTAGTPSAFNQEAGTHEVTAPYYAFYPASIAGYAASGTLPAIQTYTPDKATNLPMYAYSATEKSLTFKNICGVLKIKVPSGYQVNMITVSTTDDKALHGAFTVNGDNVAVMNVTSSVPEANRTLTVNQTSNTNTEILVAIPAATYSNLTITVKGTSDNDIICTGTVNNLTITANHIKKITFADYFYIEAVEAGTIQFNKQENAKANAISLQYSTDRLQWFSFYNNTSGNSTDVTINTEAGKRYYFRAPSDHVNESFGNNDNITQLNVYQFNISGSVRVGGDIMYLLNNTGQHNTMNSRAFSHLFQNAPVTDASALKLPSESTSSYCYQGMFEACTQLVAAPLLPSTSVTEGCYKDMFKGCSSLTTDWPTTILLKAEILADRCYYKMFEGCSSLSQLTMLATDVNANECLTDWLNKAGGTTKAVYLGNNMTSNKIIIDNTMGWTISVSPLVNNN